MSVGSKVLDEDFVICVRPQMDKNFNWTSEVNVFIMTSDNNPLNDDDYYGVLDFCRALCATIAIMEKDDDLRKRAVKEAYKYEKDEKPKLKIVDKKDNVVVLSFDSDNDNEKQ
jgi:hypothetical protein